MNPPKRAAVEALGALLLINRDVHYASGGTTTLIGLGVKRMRCYSGLISLARS